MVEPALQTELVDEIARERLHVAHIRDAPVAELLLGLRLSAAHLGLDVTGAHVHAHAVAKLPAEVGSNLVDLLALGRNVGALHLRPEIANIEHAVAIALHAIVEIPILLRDVATEVHGVTIDYRRAD